MAKYLVVYRGGDPDGGSDDDVMTDWMNWFASLGDSVVEMGNPLARGTAIAADGSRSDGTAGLSGYTLIEADGLDAAAAAVAECPHLKTGGSIEVYEAVAM